MGAYSDSRILTQAESAVILDRIIMPAITGMAQEGRPFTGFLYAGLMLTAEGAKVLEFNARLGDPETQPLMHRLDCDFAPALEAAGRGSLAGAERLAWRDGPSVCVVLAAHGYPGQVRTGDVITGIEAAESEGAVVFHAGTRMERDGRLITAGGRVLGITAGAGDLRSAIDAAYAAAEHIGFEGMHCRRDIGAKGLRKWSTG
jgi:phosphoribosylamine--glycine ligase